MISLPPAWVLHANETRDGSLLGKLELCKRFTINILTSRRLRTSSTSARGFPLGTGMVPRMEQLEASSVCLTARINAWLNSSIFPISSMTNSLLLPSRILFHNQTQHSARHMMWNTSSRKCCSKPSEFSFFHWTSTVLEKWPKTFNVIIKVVLW